MRAATAGTPRLPVARVPVFVLVLVLVPACAGGPPKKPTADELRTNGALGFPQADATVLCDRPDLRVSACCDDDRLYVQAIIWGDGDPALGAGDDDRPIGDSSALSIDVDADSKRTPELDRSYAVNPWPDMPGLHYSVWLGENEATPLDDGSAGSGCIRYIRTAEGSAVRVDGYLVPLAEIGKKPGEKVRVLFWAKSPSPDLVLNSAGFTAPGKKVTWPHHVPLARYHEVALELPPHTLAFEPPPDDRKPRKPPAGPVKVGEPPPDFAAEAWLNHGGEAPTLARLRGRVVLLELWATWCGPCRKAIPHLNELHAKHRDAGLVLLSFTAEERPVVEPFVKETGIAYPIGLKSSYWERCGVTGIPWAILVGRDGKVLWQGNSLEPALDEQVRAALAAK